MSATADDGNGKRATAVANERVKPLANAFDRASTAGVTVGILGPTAAALDGVGVALPDRSSAFYGVSAIMWLMASALLHAMARRALGTLR